MKKKTLKRGVALLLTVVMMMAMMSVSAFASGKPLSVEGKTVKFQQEITLEADESMPNAAFTYAIAPGSDSGEIKAGVGTPSVESAEFSATNDYEGVYKEVVGVDFSSVTFPSAGIYRYNVIQTSVDNGFSATTTPLYLDVYVAYDASDALVITGAEMKDGTGKVNGFINDYTTYDLTLSKVVPDGKGNQGYKFNFDVTLTGDGTIGNVAFAVTKAGGAEGPDTLTASTSGVATGNYKLKHDSSIVIKSVTSGVAYSIVENVDESLGYDVSITINDTDATTATGTMDADQNVVVTNTRVGGATPTGIITTFAPYVLMLVAAAAIGFVFFRRREHDC